MTIPMRLWFTAAIVVLAVTTGQPSWAQEQMPPDRAGRVSVIEGRMTVKNATDVEWNEAMVNYPVSAGMSFANAPGGRAELQLGGSTLRLDGRTTVTILALNDTTTIVQLEDGSVNVRTHVLFDNERVVIDAPNGHFTILQAGAFRIDSDPTRAVVFQGRGELETQRGREAAHATDAVEANPTGLVRHRPAEATALDDWADARERALAAPVSQQYVGAGMPGAEDLDHNGDWQETPDYGPVWYPDTVPATWQPYVDGTWMWVDPWGWTWVDAQPWGFAPFHYGRWVSIRGRWAWSPGQRVGRPVYAPALVGFVGSDPSRFRSRTVRPDHWVPLAPGEIYRPPYSRDAAYVERLNRAEVHGNVSEALRQGGHDDYANERHFRDHVNDNAGTAAMGRPARPPIVVTDRPRNALRQSPDAAAPVQERAQDRALDHTQDRIQDRERPAGGAQATTPPQYQPRQQTQAPPSTATPTAPNPASGANFRDPGANTGQPQARPQARFGGPRPYGPGQDNDAGQGNLGQGNLGQSNTGQGNVGQGNVGQGNVGQGPGPMPGQRQHP